MKLLLWFSIIAFSGVFSYPHDGLTNFKVGNAIDDLIREALEAVRKALKEHDPLKLPELPVQEINDPEGNIFLTAVLTDSYLSKAENFVIDYIDNNLLQMTGRFGLSVPELGAATKFNINGTALGKGVSGQGNIDSTATGVVTNGFVQLKTVDNYLQIDEMQLNYTIQGLEFHEQGLVVQGMSQEEVQKLFGPTFLKFFQDNEPLVSGKLARQFKIEANQLMKGKTLQDLIDMLKNFINPT